jgi:class 3 adenylate cyclase
MDVGDDSERSVTALVPRMRRSGGAPVRLHLVTAPVVEDEMAASRRGRVLTTVLITDVVDSTGHAMALGDHHWLVLLERHEAMVRHEIRQAGGRPVVAVGDGVIATFRGAVAAVCCALAIADASRTLGLEVRCGLHCGESERRGARLGGIVFHVAARIVALAQPGEVLVSDALIHLASGSTLRFHERGRRTLHGLPGRWPVYGVTAAATQPPAT